MNNLSIYPKAEILLKQNSLWGITWRGYLTRLTLLAIGFGSYILLTNNKIDLSKDGKRCFYALRKYFPNDKEGGEEVDKVDEEEEEEEEKNEESQDTEKDKDPSLSSSSFSLTARNDNNDEITTENTKTTIFESQTASPIINNECKNKSLNNVFQIGDKRGNGERGEESSSSYLFPTLHWNKKQMNYLKKNILIIILSLFAVTLIFSFISIKFKLIKPYYEFIGYGSTYDFLMPLFVMPTIYIWLIYRDNT